MSVTKILDHQLQALQRLLQQYKDKPNIQAVIDTYTKQIQELEDALFPLLTVLSIPDSEGYQLDVIGKIVDQPRTTPDDARYRILLYVKIGQNVSQGEPERIINVYKLLTESEYVHYINLTSAEIQLLGTEDFPDQDEVNFVFTQMQRVVAAGVRINYLLVGDPSEAFAYAGVNPNAPALGYDDGAGSGGKYAKHYTKKMPFAYAGNDPDAGGYGAGSADPLVGGVYTV